MDFDSESSQFRLGSIRNLEVRVEEAFRRGAIAYVPSQARRFDPTGKGEALNDKMWYPFAYGLGQGISSQDVVRMTLAVRDAALVNRRRKGGGDG